MVYYLVPILFFVSSAFQLYHFFVKDNYLNFIASLGFLIAAISALHSARKITK